MALIQMKKETYKDRIITFYKSNNSNLIKHVYYYIDGVETGYSPSKETAFIAAKREIDNMIPTQNELERLKKSRPLGHPTGMGYYNACPKCGGKLFNENQKSWGYGAHSTTVHDLKCEDCGWKTHITLD